MDNSQSNTNVLEPEVLQFEGPQPEQSPQFSKDSIEDMKMFAANRMFHNVTFQQVLATIDLQCRQQAEKRINEASQEDLNKIYADMQQSLAQQYEAQEAQKAQQTCADPDCDQDPETCDKPDCSSK
jgi:hypothetical protein